MEATVNAPIDRTRENRVTSAFVAVALVALFIGVCTGLLQGLEHAGIDLYSHLSPVIRSYYHGLSIHGVLNVLVFTTFFISGFLLFLTPRALEVPLASLKLAWITFALMMVGLVLAAIPLLANEATVMFTFYLPMRAHWAFYIGLTLVVVATWLVTLNLVLTYRVWRATHPGVTTPLAAYMALVTFFMWTIASLGIATEMLALAIPFSLGLVSGTDPLLARVLFWFTGHPIVYFWLLPAYISWYTLMPRQVGGRLFSEPMARVSFLMFLLLSTPVGLHHQFTDPGIMEGMKFLHGFLTFCVFFPSLLTFFNVVASLESGGRAHGGKGWFAWFGKLPWGDPSVAAQLVAMLTFAAGGIGGLINASLAVNLVVHNTAWVPGHLHLTVGTAVTLTFIGITYWLVPHLSGKALWSRRMALAQVWTWGIAMFFFSHSMHRLGLMGMPRRTAISVAPYLQTRWSWDLKIVGIGGALLFASAMLYFLNIVLTLMASRGPAPEVPRFAEPAMTTSPKSGAIMDRFGTWLVVAAVLIVLAYGPTLLQIVLRTPLDAKGFRVW